MCRWPDALLLALLLVVVQHGVAATEYPGIGRAATDAEIASWDIDVRPDLRGLPAGSGSVAQGAEVYAAKCAACHGEKGESAAVFTPLIGGTTAADVASGHALALQAVPTPPRTLFMKVATISSVYDYIRRAMPWDRPKSLSTGEVYAVLAYLLHLADIVPADFVLSEANMAEVQAKLPNRAGMSTDHGLWPGARAAHGGMGNGGTPDVRGAVCMSDCVPGAVPGPALPPGLRDSQGNIEEHNRNYGPVRGIPAAAR